MTDYQKISGEIWKPLSFDFEYSNDLHLEISNFGRIRSKTSKSEWNILKGTMINGYRIVRIKFFTERDSVSQTRLDAMKEQIMLLIRQIGKMRTRNKAKRVHDESYFEVEQKIKEQTELLNGLKLIYQKELRASNLKRTINRGELIHRLVATYFLEKPSPEHTLVAHLDHNKLNNRVENLRWMTQEENTAHQRTSPHVKAALVKRKEQRPKEQGKTYKLTSTKVLLIKKRIQEGVTLRTLAKNFKVTETQLLRIKRGENWAHVKLQP